MGRNPFVSQVSSHAKEQLKCYRENEPGRSQSLRKSGQFSSKLAKPGEYAALLKGRNPFVSQVSSHKEPEPELVKESKKVAIPS